MRLQKVLRGVDGEVVAVVQQGDFEGLGLGEGWCPSAWFCPGEVVGEGCV